MTFFERIWHKENNFCVPRIVLTGTVYVNPVRYLLQDGVNTVRYLLSNGVKALGMVAPLLQLCHPQAALEAATQD